MEDLKLVIVSKRLMNARLFADNHAVPIGAWRWVATMESMLSAPAELPVVILDPFDEVRPDILSVLALRKVRWTGCPEPIWAGPLDRVELPL